MLRRTRAFSTLWIGAVVASIVIYVALDSIACPDGYGDPTANRARVGGKFRIQLTCHAGGAEAEGSMALVILSWVGLFLLITIGGYKLWNKLKPIPNEYAPTPSPTTPLSDKKDRRKARKQAGR